MRLPHNIHHIIIIHRRRLGSTPTTASAHPAATTTPRRHADTRDSCTRPSLRPHYHTMRPRAPAPRDHQHGPRNMDIDIMHLNPRASALRDTRIRTPLKLTRTTTTHATAVPLLSPPTTALPIPMPFLIPEATCQPTSAVYVAKSSDHRNEPGATLPRRDERDTTDRPPRDEITA